MDSAREAVAGWTGTPPTPAPGTIPPARGSGATATAWSPACSCTTCPGTATRSCTCTCAIWNRVQRADGADDKWRTLDSRTLHNQRLGVAPVADRALETRLSALGLRHGAPGGRQRRRGRRGQPGRDGPVQLPRRRRHRRTETARPASTRPGTAGRRAGARCGCCTSRPGRTPAAPRPRPAAPSPGRPAPPNPPRRSGWPPGKRRPCGAKCARCPRCTSRSPGSPPSAPARAPAVLDDAAKRTAARIAVAEVQRHHAVWSMAQLRFEVHRALPGAATRQRRRGGGHRGGQAGRLRPGRRRGRPGHRPGHHRRDQPGRARLGRRQHLPAAERGTVLHAGPPGHRGADPHRRQTEPCRSSSATSRPGPPPSAPG